MARINYKNPPKKVMAAAALVALLGFGAAQLAVDTIADFEGYVPEAYQDPVGIPTKCFGDTTDVVLGQSYTFDECAKSINDQIFAHAAPILRCVPSLKDQNPKVKAAAVSMAYNIGVSGFCSSSVARYFNAGDYDRGCRRMAEIYKTAKGRELPGLVRRRHFESAMCLEGLRDDLKEGR